MITGQVFLSEPIRKYPLIRFLANLLRCLWLFFPAIVFILLALFCFTKLEQGKDILISFTETSGTFGGILLSKFIFAIAIIFWVYVSWYACRMVAYIKETQHRKAITSLNPAMTQEEYNASFAMERRFLQRFPRIIGYACLVVVLLSLILLVADSKWLVKQPFVILLGIVFLLWLGDRQMIRISSFGHRELLLKSVLWTAGILLPFLWILYSATGLWRKVPFIITLVILMLVVYMLYINLRRHRMEELMRKTGMGESEASQGSALFRKLMAFYHLPAVERNYFVAFNLICGFGLAAYLAGIFFLSASNRIGPFPFLLLAFTVLLGFGSIITALSCKYGISLHFFIILFGALLPTPDHHRVRLTSLSARQVAPDIYQQRADIKTYFTEWVKARPEIDSVSSYPVYIVLANGGASRSAYWVASVLGKLEDASIRAGKTRFSHQVLCLSGTSGGGVGIASFYAFLLHQQAGQPGYEMASRKLLRQDFLTFTLARMLGPDVFNYIPVLNWIVPDEDRAEALEQAIENARDDDHLPAKFEDTYFDECISLKNQAPEMPILFINTTRVKDGNPGVVSSIALSPELFNRRVDVVNLLQPDQTFRLSTAAILGARFPFISPAGRIDSYQPYDSLRPRRDTLVSSYFVDGGYFDNSGAGVVQEMMRAITSITASGGDTLLQKRYRKLSLTILHITNSPLAAVPLQPIGPFVNDVFAPLLTITGAFDMQTTVNDRRMINYINDLQANAVQLGIGSARYYPIHLYNDPEIPGDSLSKGPYAMNWFISDSVRNQMDRRLASQPRLHQLLEAGTAPVK